MITLMQSSTKNLMKNSLLKTTLPRLTLIAALFAGCFIEPTLHAQNLPMLGDTGREDLSPVMERKLGEEIMLGIRQDKDYIDDEPASEFLNDFGAKLLEAHQEARGDANYDFYFFTVRDTMLNAFALPGGFIGVHSALILAAHSESELASVLAHEIGHVSQRHIARMIGNQKQDALIPIASMILAALLIRASPDAAIAVAMGGEGLAIQRQLDFSQNAEREADRVGLQILRDGHFDPTGMVAFFSRMQNSARGYSDNVPAFLRTHPLTSERIADIQSRIQSETFSKHIDNPDYQLFRARIRVLQDETTQGLIEAKSYFNDQMAQAKATKTVDVNAEYGLAFIAYKQRDFQLAQQYLDLAIKDSGDHPSSVFFTSLQLDILLTSKQNEAALAAAEKALQAFPTSRGIGRQYSDALIANNQVDAAITYLRDQTLLYRKDFLLQAQLAKAYAAAGKEALQHLALAESLALSGAISPAIDQLSIARRSPDGTFYDHAIIDARERDLKERFKDELEVAKKKGE
ncbi:M48 family metalloprotease [Sapientia aquatica]|nr:M48 family metalloprotease [Sapientia aquatica]